MKIKYYIKSSLFIVIGFFLFSLHSFASSFLSCPQKLNEIVVTKNPTLIDNGKMWRLLNGITVPGKNNIKESGFVFISHKKATKKMAENLIRDLVFDKQEPNGACYYIYSKNQKKFSAAYLMTK